MVSPLSVKFTSKYVDLDCNVSKIKFWIADRYKEEDLYVYL